MKGEIKMKKFIVLTYVFLLAALTIYTHQNSTLHQGFAVDLIQSESGEEASGQFVRELNFQQNCTLIYASDGRMALAGNNEDWTCHQNDIWFLPPEKGKFGRVYFGFNFNGEHIPQGGMNDHGLFYDGASAESVIKPPRDSSIIPPVDDLHLKAMEECSTVEEVLKSWGWTSNVWGSVW
jgi:hypothetical protein